MGKVITVMNMKGGVGKTTVTAHLGGVLGRYIFNGQGYKVLLIDYDAQFNLSQALIPATKYYELEKARKTCLSILQDDESVANPYEIQLPGSAKPPPLSKLVHSVYKSARCQVDLIPSTLDLMYLALGQSERRLTPLEDRFRVFIDECRKAYDFVFVDCHPAGSVLTKTSLQNSDHVLIPVLPQRYAVRGVQLMMNFIAAKRLGSPGPVPHILFNSVPRIGIAEEEAIIRGDAHFKDKCMATTLKSYKIFSEPVEGQGFAWKSGKPWSGVALKNLWAVAHEFLQRTKDGTTP